MDLSITTATAEDLPTVAVADGRAFGMHYTEQDLADLAPVLDPSRFLLARDGGRLAGITTDFPFRMTVPGGATLEIPGVSWVSVATTHRRRGVLRALITAQHRRYADAGVAVSALTASEGGIYGRFGYGPATSHRVVEVDRSRARFRGDVPDPGGVWQAESAEARAHAPAVHERWRALTPGALDRNGPWWDFLFLDREHGRRGGSALFFLLHADGYASYRIDRAERRCRVTDLFAATDEAHIALWRVLLGLDLVETVTAQHCPVDDPLPFLLTDPRLVRTAEVADGMWLRLLDVPAALGARSYAAEVDVVLEVADGFLERGGRFRLRGGPEGAVCEPTDRQPQVRTDAATLGSLYLGGHRPSTAARAGVLTADPGALWHLDAAFRAEREPQHGTGF